MQYTESQLNKLIADVEKEFTAHLTKSEEISAVVPAGSEEPTLLAKAEDEKSLPPKDKKDEKEPESEEKPKANPAENQAAPAHGAKAPEETKPEAAHAAPGHGYDDEDLAHMRQMYSSMSQEELKAHHDCIADLAKCGGAMAAPMGKSEAGKSELKDENPTLNSKPHDKGSDMFPDPQNGGIEGAPPHNALGAKSAASDANGAKINKSESARRNGGEIDKQALKNTPGAKSPASKADGVQMEKSEGNVEVELLKSELSSEKTKYEELKKQFDGVAAFLTKLVQKTSAPAAKAITSLDVIAKSEGAGADDEKTLSKVEIDSILNKKASDSTLKKSDRDAINTYYLGDKDIKGISHLLK